MIEHNSEVYNHPYISFIIVHVYMEEDLCRGGCILHCCVRSSLVSLLFAVLVSLHPATFLMFFITCIYVCIVRRAVNHFLVFFNIFNYTK